MSLGQPPSGFYLSFRSQPPSSGGGEPAKSSPRFIAPPFTSEFNGQLCQKINYFMEEQQIIGVTIPTDLILNNLRIRLRVCIIFRTQPTCPDGNVNFILQHLMITIHQNVNISVIIQHLMKTPAITMFRYQQFSYNNR